LTNGDTLKQLPEVAISYKSKWSKTKQNEL
jgi:hypothetical protein